LYRDNDHEYANKYGNGDEDIDDHDLSPIEFKIILGYLGCRPVLRALLVTASAPQTTAGKVPAPSGKASRAAASPPTQLHRLAKTIDWFKTRV
jgi:hypothetical protein